jgi:4'-phosphopantetheinyl transferase
MREIALSAFRPAPPPQPLGDAEIHLWFFPQWPGPARAAAESVPVRRLLAAYTQHVPCGLEFQRDVHGKPRLASGELEFNLSHSGSALLLALSRRQPLGVDLEMPRRSRPVLELARRYFGADEAAALSALPENMREQAFLRLWACKEAVLKAHGGGISLGLELVTFEIDDNAEVTALIAASGPLSSADWRVVKLALGADAYAALAWHGPEHKVQPYIVAGS